MLRVSLSDMRRIAMQLEQEARLRRMTEQVEELLKLFPGDTEATASPGLVPGCGSIAQRGALTKIKEKTEYLLSGSIC